MKKLIRISSMLLVLAALCSLLVFPASAASITAYECLSNSKYAKTYALSETGSITVYMDTKLETPGNVERGECNAWIDCAADDLRVMDVGVTGSNVWAKVSYPITGTSTRRTGYIPLSAITPNTHAVRTIATGKFYCARRQGYSNNSNYWVDKGDEVWMLAQIGDQVQILYPAGSTYRIAFCNKTDYEKYCGPLSGSSSGGSTTTNPNSDMIDVTAYFAGKSITIQSVQNGKYLHSDAAAAYLPLCAKTTTATAWDTFTVELTADGWAGFKARNGKYLSATANAADTPIRTVADKLQSWECFRIYQKGSDFYLKAQVNGKWLCVRVDQSNAPLQAYASTPSTWERLNIQVVGEEMYVAPAEIARTASENGISPGSNAYKALQSLNSKYASQLSASDEQGTVVAMFEGVGNNASASKRMNAMCLVIKNGDIVYLNRSSSTIPDYPFDPAKNSGTHMPTIKSGIHSFTTVNHWGKYAALNVTNAPVVRFSSRSAFYSSTSTGINVHRRDSNSIPASGAGWVNSAGCLLVGQSGKTSIGEYARFIQALGIVGSGTGGSSPYTSRVSGKIIVDRTWAYSYLQSVGYSDSAISMIG